MKIYLVHGTIGPNAVVALTIVNVFVLLFTQLFCLLPAPASFEQTSNDVPAQITSKKNNNICYANPYRDALTEPLEEISGRMMKWLEEDRNLFGAQSLDQQYRGHDHQRFSPFVSMANCKPDQLECVGGPCGSDLAKTLCGLKEHLAIRDNDKQDHPVSCVVYSIGGNNKWDFENALLAMTPCEIHTFDCTGTRERFVVPEHPRLHFHHVCLTAYSQNGKHVPDGNMIGESWTLLEMQQKLNHSRIDLLKMDIEGWEWPLYNSWPELDHVAVADQILMPMQIAVEIHYQTQFGALHPDRKDFKNPTDIVELQTHLLRMGYVIAVRDDNRACAHCTELTLIRIQCPNTGVYSRGGASSRRI